MANPITMPKFGQMTEESAIVEWRKQEGVGVGACSEEQEN
jgi:pyruvate/2-oxoglutarate dehydrogenase complex dihydrolipoamide acyltransferase (E2) component